jgi:hypothetical protein
MFSIAPPIIVPVAVPSRRWENLKMSSCLHWTVDHLRADGHPYRIDVKKELQHSRIEAGLESNICELDATHALGFL